MIRLYSDKDCIMMDEDSNGWCKCWLVNGNIKIYLGAEDKNYIKKHLISGLKSNPSKHSGQIEGNVVFWALSFAEAHHALYIASKGTEKILMFQNANAEIVCSILLSQKNLLEWCNQLEAWDK